MLLISGDGGLGSASIRCRLIRRVVLAIHADPSGAR